MNAMRRFSGERRGVAATVLAFYGFIYFLVALSGVQPEWAACYWSMAAIYGLGFFSLVAGYFWARWYAVGLGFSGLITAIFAMFSIGFDESLLFYGGTHALISLALWGKAMALPFDGRKDWRERFHIDENGVNKLGKAVIRAAVSLPYVVIYALAPKEGMDLAGILALVLAGTGIWALIKMRTWGVLALGGAAAALATGLFTGPTSVVSTDPAMSTNLAAAIGLVAVIGAIIPFARPLYSYLKA